MKTRGCVSVAVFVALVLTIMSGRSDAEENYDFTDFYVRSLIDPQTFSDYVLEQRRHFDRGFHECLHLLLEVNTKAASEHLEVCNKLRSTSDLGYNECVARDAPSAAALWLLSFKLVVEEQERWEETQAGQWALQGKQLMEVIFSSDFYASLVRTAAHAASPLLSCKRGEVEALREPTRQGSERSK